MYLLPWQANVSLCDMLLFLHKCVFQYVINIYETNKLSATLNTESMVKQKLNTLMTGPRSAVGNVSGYRCVSDCRSRGRKFDPGPVPYFRGD